jgi:hypothetical protein
MKKIKLSILLLISFLFFQESQAQEIRGADMDFARLSNFHYRINISLYFLSEQEVDRPFLRISFGDGIQDTVWLNTQQNIAQNVWKLNYQMEHVYPSFGNFNVAILDSIPLPEIKNYDYQEGDLFRFSGFLLIHFSQVSTNEPPVFLNLQTETYFEEGKWHHQVEVDNPDGDKIRCFFNDFNDLPIGPYLDLNLPQSSDTFLVNDNTCELTWDKPIEPGKYLIPVFVQDYLQTGPNNFLALARCHRVMIVDVKEEDIISSTVSLPSSNNFHFSISPNPVIDILNINFERLPKTTTSIRLYNLLGQELLYKSLTGTIQEQIDLSLFENGIYLVVLEDNGNVIGSQKIIVNH